MHAKCFDTSYSDFQLPYEMGLISSISKMRELRLRKPQIKCFCCCLLPSPMRTCPSLRLHTQSPTPVTGPAPRPGGTALPLLLSSHLSFLVCCPLPAWLLAAFNTHHLSPTPPTLNQSQPSTQEWEFVLQCLQPPPQTVGRKSPHSPLACHVTLTKSLRLAGSPHL